MQPCSLHDGQIAIPFFSVLRGEGRNRRAGCGGCSHPVGRHGQSHPVARLVQARCGVPEDMQGSGQRCVELHEMDACMCWASDKLL